MWIARDKDGDLWLYSEKPTKGANTWGQPKFSDCMQIKEDGVEYLYDDIKWSDREPTEVKLVKK